jgi:ABC-2 type transport system ATP-binding protein
VQIGHEVASRLSGGWRQRLALSCAILHRPRVLFLDEPTAGLDPVSRRLFWELIHTLNDSGTTIFVTTHQMEELERCHRVGLLDRGRLRLLGSPDQLRADTGQRYQLCSLECREPERVLPLLRQLPGLKDAYLFGQHIHLTWPAGSDGIARTRSALAAAGIVAERLEVRTPTMEDVFVIASEAP